MEQKRMKWVMLLLTVWLFWRAGGVLAQDSELQIWLRASDGTAVAGETIILERMPEAEPYPACTTDVHGQCAWRVGRGLYQVLFARPLDDISTLAVAEGGLRGLGVTVGDSSSGDAAIAYYFTFHSDGRVYFDAAPEAAIPSPIIPVGHGLQGGVAPTPTPEQGVDVTATPFPELAAQEEAPAGETGNTWRLLLFIGGGLVIGGGLHLLARQRSKPDDKPARRDDEETKNA
jgi:hypothetical protein